MKRLIPLTIGIALLALSPISHGAPKKKNKPPTSQPGKSKQQPAPQPTPQAKTQHTTSGVILSMMVDKDGQITEIALKIAGNVNTEWIKGCGAKSADQPLLNWAFTSGYLVHVTVDANDCYMNALVPRP
jgi:hypothetical protein